jgi:hypothetical protein
MMMHRLQEAFQEGRNGVWIDKMIDFIGLIMNQEAAGQEAALSIY